MLFGYCNVLTTELKLTVSKPKEELEQEFWCFGAKRRQDIHQLQLFRLFWLQIWERSLRKITICGKKLTKNGSHERINAKRISPSSRVACLSWIYRHHYMLSDISSQIRQTCNFDSLHHFEQTDMWFDSDGSVFSCHFLVKCALLLLLITFAFSFLRRLSAACPLARAWSTRWFKSVAVAIEYWKAKCIE